MEIFPGILMSLFPRIFKRNQTKWRVNLDINYICRQKNLNFLNKTSPLILCKVERKDFSSETFQIDPLDRKLKHRFYHLDINCFYLT